MKLSLFGGISLALATLQLSGQIVPQQKTPPIFQGEKRGKDEDAKTRSLTGVVSDESEKVADGAVVQLKDTKSLQVRSFITKQDGTYHFHGLSPDIDYQVKAVRRGTVSDVKTLSVFDNRKTAVINLKLEKKK
jgi:Carboxypeptidase regulatory-like domain